MVGRGEGVYQIVGLAVVAAVEGGVLVMGKGIADKAAAVTVAEGGGLKEGEHEANRETNRNMSIKARILIDLKFC